MGAPRHLHPSSAKFFCRMFMGLFRCALFSLQILLFSCWQVDLALPRLASQLMPRASTTNASRMHSPSSNHQLIAVGRPAYLSNGSCRRRVSMHFSHCMHVYECTDN